MKRSVLVPVFTLAALAIAGGACAQTREKGPWWPSVHGAADQAGNSNYITPDKIMSALKLAKTGKTYELGNIYDGKMPQFTERPYYLNVPPAPPPKKVDDTAAHGDYFTGYIGQMGTQFDGLGHMGRAIRMPDGSVKAFFYNGFTEEELTGTNSGQGGLENLGVEHVKPIITRGVLIDIAAYKGVATLGSRYEVTLADVRGALAREGLAESSIQPGDAVLFNYGWAVNWTQPQKYNDGNFFVGENQGSPGIGHEVARWLAEKKVAMVGADSCCVMIMPPNGPDPMNVHLDLIPNGVFILENMNLLELSKDRVYEFLYLNLTERIRGATGSPVRPIAIR